MSPVKARKRLSRRELHHGTSSFGSRTDIGCIRERNEDSLIVSPPLFAVADGMGGHAAGDVASEVAVTVLGQYAPKTANVAELGQAVVNANMAVISEAQKSGHEGMGTTMTAAIVEKNHIAIAHVGDSRAYLLHHGKLQQITRDHSLMADMIEAGRITPEEARVHPNRSIITRALGSDPAMQPDLYELTASAGDRLLLCSDGLYGMIEDDQIQTLLARTRDPQRCASTLVNSAISAGGTDNITVVVVDIEGEHDVAEKNKANKTRAWLVVIIAMLVAILGIGAYAMQSFANETAFLTVENGRVAVYKGNPDDLFGVKMSRLDHVTDIRVSRLEPGVQARLKEGIRVNSVEEADAIIAQYKADLTGTSDVEKNAATNTKKAKNTKATKKSVKDTKSEKSTKKTSKKSGN